MRKIFSLDRAFITFLALEVVSFLERNGFLLPSLHQQNIDTATEVMSWIFSGVVAIAWFIYHHNNKTSSTKLVSDPTDKKKFVLYDIVFRFKDLIFQPKQSKTEEVKPT